MPTDGEATAYGSLSAADVRALDTAAADLGVEILQLMEVAGHQVARAAWDLLARRPGAVTVLAGRGNNGGDGLVAARLLRVWGCDVAIHVVAEEPQLRGLVAHHLTACRADGIDCHIDASVGALSASCREAALIIDALLGTGMSGPPRAPEARAIDVLTRASGDNAVVLSVDVPSGVDATTGRADDACVVPMATLCLSGVKVGLWTPAGRAAAGRLMAADVGIPREAWRRCGLVAPTALRGGEIVEVDESAPRG